MTDSAKSARDRIVPILFALLLTVALAYAVWSLSTPIAQTDRQGRDSRNLYVLLLGVIGVAHAAYSLRHPSRGRNWLALLLPGYVAFQLLPLPLWLLRVMSPVRAELVDALAPLGLATRFAPISVAPSLTLTHFLLFSGYAVVFFVVRGIANQSRETPWLTVLPILGVGAWQGLWGLSQFAAGGPQPFGHGTYSVRNHYAGLLEMSLPFAVAFAGAAFEKRNRWGPLSTSAALRAGLGFAAAAFIGAGILSSLSRMGFLASAASLVVMGIMAIAVRLHGKKRWSTFVALALAVVIVFVFLAPAQLAARFSDVSSEGRSDVWRDTLHLIAAYPVFGTGLGGYQAAFERFKTSEFAFNQDYAHNDFLQFLAELGIVGFSIGGIFLSSLLLRAVRVSLRPSNPTNHWLGLACTGALAAILIHSLADFNLYVPANAILLAWICGIAAGGLADPS